MLDYLVIKLVQSAIKCFKNAEISISNIFSIEMLF